LRDYRIYIIGRDGHFAYAIPLQCPDDNAAKAEAARLVDGQSIELWQLDRKVEAFQPTAS
jgi:hypothetical protein